MRLRKNDLIKFTENGADKVFYIQVLSGSTIVLAPHNEANADARNRSKEDPFSFVNKAASSLQSSNARRVHISATGLLSEA